VLKLTRKGVENELENTLSREARDGGASYLVPIVIDDFVYGSWSPIRSDHKEAILERVHSDFRRAVEFKDGKLKVINTKEFILQIQKLISTLELS
jgi:hypothetical protein